MLMWLFEAHDIFNRISTFNVSPADSARHDQRVGRRILLLFMKLEPFEACVLKWIKRWTRQLFGESLYTERMLFYLCKNWESDKRKKILFSKKFGNNTHARSCSHFPWSCLEQNTFQ